MSRALDKEYIQKYAHAITECKNCNKIIYRYDNSKEWFHQHNAHKSCSLQIDSFSPPHAEPHAEMIDPDDHNFVDKGDELHTCEICGDYADSWNHVNDPSVNTTPLSEPAKDSLDELLTSADWIDQPDGKDEEDLPLDYNT